MVWHFDQSRSYTVKSRYRAKLLERFGMGTRTIYLSQWWRGLWHLAIPPKIKILLWKVYYNAFPIRVNLHKRRTLVDQYCPMCGEEREIATHYLIVCERLIPLWHASGLWELIKPKLSSSMNSLLTSLFFSLNVKD